MPNAPTALERPLVLDGESVRALLDGRKTQHRVPVARLNSYVDGHRPSLPLWEALDLSRAWVDGGPSPAGNPGPYLQTPTFDGDASLRLYSRVQVGDRLSVREAMARDDAGGWRYVADAAPIEAPPRDLAAIVKWGMRQEFTHACSARRMPRWASRLTLEVTEVDVRRIQMLEEDEALAEGMAREWKGAPCSAVAAYRESWDRRHYARGHGWDANPFVWVFTFNRVNT